MNPDDAVTDAEVAEAMRTYGGGFIRALVELYQRADPVNRRRLQDAFADYFETYRQVALGRRAAREADRARA